MRRILVSAFVVYALVMTAATLSPVREVWDEILGPNEAQFFIVTAASIDNVSVTYDGRHREPRPGWHASTIKDYAAFPNLRTRAVQPVLHVSWEGPDGARSLSRVMRQFDSGRVCLYVLSLDSAGVPISPEPSDEFSPFWWTCHLR
jgi:hypothetical protein